MATPVAMPKLGMTMQEGTVVAWPAALGARVEKGQTVVIIESEKAEVEIGATRTGYFRHIYVEPDPDVPLACGSLLGALTDTADEPFDANVFHLEHHRPEIQSLPPQPAARPRPSAPTPERRDRVAVAPAARALARKLGVDPEQLPGTGPGARVVKQDVEAWAERRKALVEVADGVSLEVPTMGQGTAVVFLPGFGTDVTAFARQSASLAHAHRVSGVNPRGVSLSDAPDLEIYQVAVAAQDAAGTIDAPAHVVGASLGPGRFVR